MNILIACEFSGIVREAFRKKGNHHNVWSCDLLPTEIEGPHIKDDILKVLAGRPVGIAYTSQPRVAHIVSFKEIKWDLIIAFPPCTALAVSGARWFKQKQKDGRQKAGIDFFMRFVRYAEKNPGVRMCIENPVGIMSTVYRKPDQIIQPFMFGHGETKATCLWLFNLPLLRPTKLVSGREARIHRMSPGPSRGMERSRTYQGIANAMANQWGK